VLAIAGKSPLRDGFASAVKQVEGVREIVEGEEPLPEWLVRRVEVTEVAATVSPTRQA
jgi:hypothetical protein